MTLSIRTITEAATSLRAGKLTPLDLLDHCMTRVEQLEERVRAWVFVEREQAREQAHILGEEWKRGYDRGLLHGIPIGVKDIFDVFDWPTAAGSKLWANAFARRDAEVVRRLRAAGAVLMGKTVTTAYASFDPPPTKNPWNLSKTPGGSSAGSAAAVACGMCLGALASQTGGSITRPASFCGVPGWKPTYQNICIDGVVPLAPSMDHVGVMAPSVRDLAVLARIMSDPDHPVKELDSPTADRPRLRTTTDFFLPRCDPAMREAFEAVFGPKGTLRAELADPLVLPAAYGEVTQHHAVIMAVEAATFHQSRLRWHPEDYPPRIRGLVEEGLRTPGPAYRRALEYQHHLRREFTQAIGDSVLIVPATLGPAPDAATTGDPALNSPWSLLGVPVVSIPFAWTSDGLPLAVQLVGQPGADSQVFVAAEWLERKLNLASRIVK